MTIVMLVLTHQHSNPANGGFERWLRKQRTPDTFRKRIRRVESVSTFSRNRAGLVFGRDGEFDRLQALRAMGFFPRPKICALR